MQRQHDHGCDLDQHGRRIALFRLAYAIVPSGAVGTGLGNYTISYVNGRLTVQPGAANDHGGQHQQDVRSYSDVRGHGVHREWPGER